MLRQAPPPGSGHLDQPQALEVRCVQINTARAEVNAVKSSQPAQLDQLALEPLDPSAWTSKQIGELPHREQRVAAYKVEDLIAAWHPERRRIRPMSAADESARDRAAKTRAHLSP